GGKGYGVLLHLTSGECLVKDNIFNKLRHSVLVQAGANGNVVAYNYSINPTWSGVMLPSNAAGDIVLHGNYAYANLFEGNVVQNIVIDNSHGKNGPLNTFFRNRAELYGLVMNNNSGNEQAFIGNEITSNGMFMGNYAISGTGHYEYANNKTGNILPAEVKELHTASLFLDEAPEYYKAKAAWPPIGFPNKLNTHHIEAQELYSKGIFTNCAIKTVSKPADTTVIKDTTVIIKDTSDISGGDTTTSRDTITTSVMANQSIRKQVNLYPNPANNYVRLYFGENGMLPIKEASAVSALGHEIKVGFSNNEVDTSNLNDGMYFLRIRLANNQTFIQKLLKQSH
ncbi:MAG: T9SS type A sorting domain-containing protein, partial [Bacteroidia bacterium]